MFLSLLFFYTLGADIRLFSSDNINISSLECNCSGYEANITLCSLNIPNNCSSEKVAGVIRGHLFQIVEVPCVKKMRDVLHLQVLVMTILII